MEAIKPPAWVDGGGKEGIEMVEDKKSVEVTKRPALGERWVGGGGKRWSRTRMTWRS